MITDIINRIRVNILVICMLCVVVTMYALVIREMQLAGVGLGGMLGFGSQILDNEASS